MVKKKVDDCSLIEDKEKKQECFDDKKLPADIKSKILITTAVVIILGGIITGFSLVVANEIIGQLSGIIPIWEWLIALIFLLIFIFILILVQRVKSKNETIAKRRNIVF